jgi:hypothetical protein
MKIALLEKAAAIDLGKVVGPEEEVERSEVVIGVLSEDLQRIYAVVEETAIAFDAAVKEIKKKADQHHKDHRRAGHTEEDCLAFQDGLIPLVDKAAALETELGAQRKVLWGLIALEFPKIAGKQVQIRKGFKITYDKIEDELEAMKENMLESIRSLARLAGRF